jgi:hypothetical protein
MGLRITPSRSILSSMPTTARPSTIASTDCIQPSISCVRPRARRRVCSKPLVVTSPTFSPPRVAMTLVTAVVPSPNLRTRGSTSPARGLPPAASRHEASTPRPMSG